MKNLLAIVAKRILKITPADELELFVLSKIVEKECKAVQESIVEEANLIFSENMGSEPGRVLECDIGNLRRSSYKYSSKVEELEDKLKRLKEYERTNKIAKELPAKEGGASFMVTVKIGLADLL